MALLATLALAAPTTAAATESSAATPSTLGTATSAPKSALPRTIVTTDPELDDLNSLLRMLLYSNEINLVGLVYSSSQHHYEGDPATGLAPHRWPDPSGVFHIDEAVNKYEEVYPNLVVHDRSFPTPADVRSLIRWGNVKNVGDMAEDTEGSELIKQVLLDDEPGQVFLQAWGGPNTIARALKSIQDEYQGTPEWDAIRDKIVKKAVLTSYGQQDTTFRDYIRPNWPELEHREVATGIWGYGARGSALPEWQKYLSPEWTRANVSDIGPIGDSYRVWGDGKFMAAGFDDEDYFGLAGYTADELRALGYGVWTPPQPKDAWISEGDSSNFALLVDNGLRNWEDPSYGGWGGRQAQNPADPYQWRNRGVADIGPAGTPRNDYAAGRWFEDFQLDFAARLQWTVTSAYADANHAPEVSIKEGLDIDREVGSTVNLTAKAKDPDGDNLTYKWYQYAEADTYTGAISLNGAQAAEASFTVPADAPIGSTIHVILEVQDDGAPAMKEYERVVVKVTPDKTRPQVSLVGPTTAGPFTSLDVRVDASDGGGLQRIVANIYKGSTLVKSTQSAMNGAGSGTHAANVVLPSGTYTIKYNSQDLAGNISTTKTFAFIIDADAPTATIKDGASFTVGANGAYDLVSFKLYDAGKVDKVVINGVTKDLSNNAWSDVNFIKPGVFGGVRGANTLVVHDVAGNTSTTTFTLN
jgi:hypothetical protein